MPRVLIAEDSYVVQRTLLKLLEGEPGIEVVGVASTGAEAVSMCRELEPDLVTMDIFMPEMDGVEATQRIMEQCPTRIVIISSMVGSDNVRMSFEAMRAGAIEVIEKPHGVLSGNYGEVRRELVRVIQELADATPVGNVSLIPPPPDTDPPVAPTTDGREPTAILRRGGFPPGYTPALICIGGSTGAPAVLVEVLSMLPADFPIPIVVAQHIAEGFARGMVDWLDAAVPPRVKLAEHRERARPGTVLISPDDRHIDVWPGNMIKLSPPADRVKHVPSITRLFQSAAKSVGPDTLGVILSGMGNDGAEGLLALREAGGVTLAQDEATSVVWGMPQSAKQLGAVMRVVAPVRLSKMFLAMGVRAQQRG
jgi:two-component system chemotaxis response regulator CheB